MPHSGIAAVGVLPLLQQPEVFLDQLVTVHGTVARAERIDARENPYKIDDYWQLWIKPSEGADRPIVAIVPDAPQIVTEIDSETTTTEGPQITVVGRFLKRLAYKSGAGADLIDTTVLGDYFALMPLWYHSGSHFNVANRCDGKSIPTITVSLPPRTR